MYHLSGMISQFFFGDKRLNQVFSGSLEFCQDSISLTDINGHYSSVAVAGIILEKKMPAGQQCLGVEKESKRDLSWSQIAFLILRNLIGNTKLAVRFIMFMY
jgi:hypothetical protein